MHPRSPDQVTVLVHGFKPDSKEVSMNRKLPLIGTLAAIALVGGTSIAMAFAGDGGAFTPMDRGGTGAVVNPPIHSDVDDSSPPSVVQSLPAPAPMNQPPIPSIVQNNNDPDESTVNTTAPAPSVDMDDQQQQNGTTDMDNEDADEAKPAQSNPALTTQQTDMDPDHQTSTVPAASSMTQPASTTNQMKPMDNDDHQFVAPTGPSLRTQNNIQAGPPMMTGQQGSRGEEAGEHQSGGPSMGSQGSNARIAGPAMGQGGGNGSGGGGHGGHR